LVAVVFVALPFGVPTAEAAGASLNWSAPVSVDVANGTLLSISCPSASFCAAVDQSGNVVTSTNPTGGPSAWTAASIDAGNSAFFSVSCPSTSLCVAVDASGNALKSTTPTGAWSPPAKISASSLLGVSCPSTSLCVAVNGDGDVLTSTDGGSSWNSPLNVDGTNLLISVSCASETLCVAVDQNGNAVTSKDPAAVSPIWTTTVADSGAVFDAVSCAPGTTDCVAVEYGGNAVSSTDGGSTWSSPAALGAHLAGVSCSSASLCVAVDDAGNVWSSTDPTNAPPTWNSASIDASVQHYMTAVSCASASFCVAVDSNGSALTSTDPTGDATKWTTAEIDASNGEPREIFGISCASTSLCVGVDDSGNVLTSTDPAGGAAAWSLTNIGTATSLESISCPTASLCVVGDGNGNVYTSTNPTGGASAWNGPVSLGLDQEFGVSCPTEALCVAVNQDGSIASSTDPTNAGAWNVQHVDGNTITSVSCPTESFCMAVDDVGNFMTSTDPALDSWTSPTTIGDIHSLDLLAVACPSTSLCVVGDGAGNVLTSTDPTALSPSWTSAHLEDNNGIGPITCPTTGLCVAVDGSGNVISSTDPTGDASAWSTKHVDDTNSLSSISCPASTVCLTADLSGNLFVGSSPPVVTTGSAGSLGETAVTLSGTVNPNGLNVSDCHFSYGIGSPSGTNAPCSALPGSGTSDVPVSANLAGLLGGMTYEFRLVAKTAGGTTFGAVGMFTTVGVLLTVSKAGAGSGTVTSSPDGISCGATCSNRYAHGTSVTLTATPAAGSSFAGWSGGGCSGIGSCTVATNADTAVTATFTLNPPQPKCVVPKVKGKTLSAAKRAIKAHACSVGRITHATSRTVKKGHVISQKPKPGSRLKHGAKVDVVVSKGRS
jgi:hypothetical protein